MLADETLEKYRAMWSELTKYEPLIMANDEFVYHVPENYEFTIIANHKLNDYELETLNKKYKIVMQEGY